MAIGILLSSSRDRFAQLIKHLKNFAYRHAWVEAHIKNGIAFQIRALRKAKQWDQRMLADNALGSANLQPMVSRYENPDYGKYSLRTLLDLAKAFDVALIIRFAAFSELIRWEQSAAHAELTIPSFQAELASGSLSPIHLSRTAIPRSLISNTTSTEKYYRPVVQPIPSMPSEPKILYPSTFTERTGQGESYVN